MAFEQRAAQHEHLTGTKRDMSKQPPRFAGQRGGPLALSTVLRMGVLQTADVRPASLPGTQGIT